MKGCVLANGEVEFGNEYLGRQVGSAEDIAIFGFANNVRAACFYGCNVGKSSGSILFLCIVAGNGTKSKGVRCKLVRLMIRVNFVSWRRTVELIGTVDVILLTQLLTASKATRWRTGAAYASSRYVPEHQRIISGWRIR